MKDVCIIGVNLGKNVYQLHDAASDGSVVFRKLPTRLQFERFMTGHNAWGGHRRWVSGMRSP